MTAPLSACVAVVPAYQAGTTLPLLLQDLMHRIAPDKIVVIDDGSADDTASVARSSGAHLVRHERNRGKGAALRTGFDWWRERAGWEAVITMDADGQHSPDDLVSLVEFWSDSGADIVTGKRRFRGSTMPWERRLSNTITSRLVSWRTRQHIDDSQCGFRVLSRPVIENVHITSDGFEAETELLIRASALGFRIASAPIRTIYAGERSSMTHWATTRAFVRTLLREY